MAERRHFASKVGKNNHPAPDKQAKVPVLPGHTQPAAGLRPLARTVLACGSLGK